jgi:hypothetical protein
MNLTENEHLFKGKSFVATIWVDQTKLLMGPTPLVFGLTACQVHYRFNQDYTGSTTTREVGRIDLPPPQHYFVWKVEQDSLCFTDQDGHPVNFHITATTPLTLTPESPRELSRVLWYTLEEKKS